MEGLEVARQWVEHSPFCQVMAIRANRLEPDDVELVMPYADHRTTWSDMVHGGALAAFADISATVAAWSGAEVPDKLRGVTVSLNVDFVTPAHGVDVVARATVTKRGRSLSFCDVVMTAEDELVARASAVYKVG